MPVFYTYKINKLDNISVTFILNSINIKLDSEHLRRVTLSVSDICLWGVISKFRGCLVKSSLNILQINTLSSFQNSLHLKLCTHARGRVIVGNIF